MVIGNFRTDNGTGRSLILPTYSNNVGADVCIDDVSCIEMDVPAYAGPDEHILLGESRYLGREKDFAVDPYCFWYQLPGMIPLDTASGITVSPTVTTTYVVRQELECNSIKWDTVVVNVGYTNVENLKFTMNNLKVYPDPADEILNVEFSEVNGRKTACLYQIVNSLGQVVREEELSFENGGGKINTAELPTGIYTLRLKSGQSRFVVQH